MSEQRNPSLVIHGRGRLVVEDLPIPTPRDDEAVVRMAFGGICGSDLHYWRRGAAGESILREPMVLGHEVSGTIALSAADGTGPVAGTEVTVHPAIPSTTAGVRFPADRPNLAPGTNYLGSAARQPHTQGAFARFVALPTRMLRTLPVHVSLRLASIAEPASVAWHAVRRAGKVRGRSALVIGAGPIGALAVAALKAAGAAPVTAVDLHEFPLTIARSLGADTVFRADDVEAIEAVQADIAIEASGTSAGLGLAMRGTARGGRVVMLGLLPTGDQPLPVALAITRELELIGSFRFIDEMDEVLEALGDGRLAVAAAITHEFALAEAEEAFEVAGDPSISGKVLLRL